MFPVITSIYNKKTKGPTLMELFTATGKVKKIFFDKWRCSICAPRVTRHTAIWYSSSCHTRVNVGASTFFTATVIKTNSPPKRPFSHYIHSHRLAAEMWTTMKNSLLKGIFSQQTLASPSGRNVNYDEKQLTEGDFLTTYTRIA